MFEKSSHIVHSNKYYQVRWHEAKLQYQELCDRNSEVTVQKNSTLGPAYNEFGYYEHPAITSKLFGDTSDWQWHQCLKSSVTTSTTYNEIFMN